MRMKGKFYKSAVRLNCMLYCSKCWVVDKNVEQRINVKEMGMLTWMSGVTKGNGIGNEHVRGSICVESIVDKMRDFKVQAEMVWACFIKREI